MMGSLRIASGLENGCLWLLLAVHAGLAMLLLGDASTDLVAVVAREALVLSQVSIAVALLILVRGWWIGRAAMVIVSVGSLTLFSRLDYPWPVQSLLTRLAFFDAAFVAVAVLILRCFGHSLTSPSQTGSLHATENAVEESSKWRFSLRSLLGLTGAAALVLGLAQAIRSFTATEALIPQTVVLASVAIEMTATTVLGVWLLLQSGSPVLRTLSFLVAATAISFLPTYVNNRDGDMALIVGWGCVHAVIVAMTVLVLRILGFRRVRQRPSLFDRLARVVCGNCEDSATRRVSLDRVRTIGRS